ncbi:MAG: hypothetical protein Q9227_006930 [Pyrenula ochraceoflavens]
MDKMFKRSFASKDRAGKSVKPIKTTYREHTKRKLQESLESPPVEISPIITVIVGRDQRLFAAHQDVLSRSPFFAAAFKNQFLEGSGPKIALPDEDPETFSCVLEYLYKGDYYPCLIQHKRNAAWTLEDAQDSPKIGGRGSDSAIIYLPEAGGEVLRDTAIYCLADKFELDELKRLALRKQGLHTGIQVDVILRSARYAYAHTPDTESRLRAHYLALIIRSRKTFKRSGTMQMEMEEGGKLFFDLFVAMCNHIDDIVEIR